MAFNWCDCDDPQCILNHERRTPATSPEPICKHCGEALIYDPRNGIRFDYRHKAYPGSYYCNGNVAELTSPGGEPADNIDTCLVCGKEIPPGPDFCSYECEVKVLRKENADLRRQLQVEKNAVAHLGQATTALLKRAETAERQLAEAREALRKLRIMGECECDHTNENCCNVVGEICVACIVDCALRRIEAEKPGKIEDEGTTPAERKAAEVKREHKTRMSDSSLYDEVCTVCGATDANGMDKLNAPCPGGAAEVPSGEPPFGSAEYINNTAPELQIADAIMRDKPTRQLLANRIQKYAERHAAHATASYEHRVKELEQYLHTERGGHLVHCNANHDNAIGSNMCCCSPYRLWTKLNDAERQLAEAREALEKIRKNINESSDCPLGLISARKFKGKLYDLAEAALRRIEGEKTPGMFYDKDGWYPPS